MDGRKISGEVAEPEYDLDIATYDRSARVFRRLKKLFKVNFELYGDLNLIEDGQIFLFNHFARFETIIPQYLFYEAKQVYCCSVASAEFFREDNVLSAFLRDMGVIPNNYRRLLPWLAAQILRGRKVVIFPEGGMVKDRQVLDRHGRYSIYSRSSLDRRQHHTGAAVLALGLNIFKAAVQRAEQEGDTRRLEAWVEMLKLDSREALLDAARQPTLIVPANITFYPLRIDEHILVKSADVLKWSLGHRYSEELLIEGNLLLRDTDMDIRLGRPVNPATFWRSWEEWLAGWVAERIRTLDDAFAMTRHPGHWDENILADGVRRCVKLVRNAYMREMYQAVTVNLSHLASTLIMQCLAKDQRNIGHSGFYRALYLALKRLQTLPDVHLHRGLQDPDAYRSLLEENHPGLQELLDTAQKTGLIEVRPDGYRLLPKLLKEHAFDEIRIENPVAVYANEVEPIAAVAGAVERALLEAEKLRPTDLVRFRFDEEVHSWRWDREEYEQPELAAVNRLETLTDAAGPFFLNAHLGHNEGVLLVHELLSCPAETRGFAERLASLGYVVLGARLKGHGTSPYDLDRCHWEDWLESLRRNYAILQACVGRIHIVGAGAGGLLALRLASEWPDNLAGVTALSPPYRFSTSAAIAPLLRGSGVLRRWLSRQRDQPFVVREPEYPHLAYRHVSLRALSELRQLGQALEERLPDVYCPTLLIQGDADPLLDPASTQLVYEELGSREKAFRLIHAHGHSLIVEDTDALWAEIIEFLRRSSAAAPPADESLLLAMSCAG
jgi:esterase/lipase